MKAKNIVVPLLIGVQTLLISCRGDRVFPQYEWGKENYPFELLDAYFPFEEGDVLDYVSDEKDTLQLKIIEKKSHYGWMGDKSGNRYETAGIYANFSCLQLDSVEYFGAIGMGTGNHRRDASWGIGIHNNYLLPDFYVDANTVVINNSLSPDAIFLQFADSVWLFANNGDRSALWVKGEGVVWFYQYDYKSRLTSCAPITTWHLLRR